MSELTNYTILYSAIEEQKEEVIWFLIKLGIFNGFTKKEGKELVEIAHEKCNGKIASYIEKSFLTTFITTTEESPSLGL